jgi:hypothetical protein
MGRPLRRSPARAGAGGAEPRRSGTTVGAGGAEPPRVGRSGAVRLPPAALALAAGALTAAVAAALSVTLGGEDAGGAGQDPPRAAEPSRPAPEVLARHPLSTRAAERRLEERYGGAGEDHAASARCSALQPRPAHAIRWCRIGYAYGGERTVIVLSDPHGYELILER